MVVWFGGGSLGRVFWLADMRGVILLWVVWDGRIVLLFVIGVVCVGAPRGGVMSEPVLGEKVICYPRRGGRYERVEPGQGFVGWVVGILRRGDKPLVNVAFFDGVGHPQRLERVCYGLVGVVDELVDCCFSADVNTGSVGGVVDVEAAAVVGDRGGEEATSRVGGGVLPGDGDHAACGVGQVEAGLE